MDILLHGNKLVIRGIIIHFLSLVIDKNLTPSNRPSLLDKNFFKSVRKESVSNIVILISGY